MPDNADPRPTVLLTGFGPFPGVPINASAELVRKAARLSRRALPQYLFTTAVLPTEWERAPRRIAALHRRFRPLLALHFGVASAATGMRLEMEARNFCRPSLDAADTLPVAEMLCDKGPEQRGVTIAVSEIESAMNVGGWPCSISHDAGGYLCNAVLYHSLACAEILGGCKVGFVHIPPDLSQPPFRMADAAAAALEIMKTALSSCSVTPAPARA